MILLKNAKFSKGISENKSSHHLQGGPHLCTPYKWSWPWAAAPCIIGRKYHGGFPRGNCQLVYPPGFCGKAHWSHQTWCYSLSVKVDKHGTLKKCKEICKGDFFCFRKVIPIWVFLDQQKHLNFNGVFGRIFSRDYGDVWDVLCIFYVAQPLRKWSWNRRMGCGVLSACDDGGWCLGKSWVFLIPETVPFRFGVFFM